MSHIDGRKVMYRQLKDWAGQVIGDSSTPGFVRVMWETPNRHIGIHRIEHLTVLDKAPSQEELNRQYHGLDAEDKPIPLQTEK